MLKQEERELLLTFIGYNNRALIQLCIEKGCKAQLITDKLRQHKTAVNNFKAKPLTKKEVATLTRFIYDNRAEFFSWCNSYQIQHAVIDSALKRMSI